MSAPYPDSDGLVPDIAEMSDPQMLAYCGDDARKWARAFVYFNSGVDEEMMVTWFANAIETSWDKRIKPLGN